VSGDIVERLRNWDDGGVSTHYEGCWDLHPVCAILLAADEIERLRAAGDALAEVADEWPELVEAWQEARRGR
jgi:hypothetical protein